MQSIDYAYGSSRPHRLSLNFSWPPDLDAGERHPNWAAKGPPDAAYNCDRAVRDFGEDWVAALQAQQPQFLGDWWLRSLLEGFIRVAQEHDPQGIEATRFEGWLLALQRLRVPIHLQGSHFVNANLDYLSLERAYITYATFDSCSARRAFFRDVDARHVTFSNCNLERLDISKARLDGAVFDKSELVHADFSETHVGGARVGTAEEGMVDVRGVTFARAVGAGMHFIGADLAGTDFTDAIMARARFVRCNMLGVNATRARLVHVMCDRIPMQNANFTSCDLSNGSLVAADLTNAILDGADLTGAKLYQADVSAVRIARAKLVGVRGLFGSNRAMARTSPIHEYESQNACYAKGAEYGFTHLSRDSAARRLLSDHVSWEWLRVIGGLKLFGVSYVSVACITIYAGIAGQLNDAADHARAVAAGAVQTDSGKTMFLAQVLSRAPKLPMPWHLGAQLFATLCVALAATIYVAACPKEVKCADEVTWTRSMGQPLWEYRSAKYARVWWRYMCFVLFIIGGLYSIVYLAWRGWAAVGVLLRLS